MRSEMVFQARQKMEGRYRLCMQCAKGTRRLHKDSLRIEDTINEVLAIIGRESHGVPERPPEAISIEESALSDAEEGFLREAQAIPVIRWDTWPF